jgi:hypothetical protein
MFPICSLNEELDSYLDLLHIFRKLHENVERQRQFLEGVDLLVHEFGVLLDLLLHSSATKLFEILLFELNSPTGDVNSHTELFEILLFELNSPTGHVNSHTELFEILLLN